MRRIVSLVLLAGSFAGTAHADTVKLSTADCRQLVQHVPKDDVTYKPGVDVRGKAVVPADVGGGYDVKMPESIDIQIGIDLADRLALRDAKRTQPTTPGLPGAPTPTPPVRKVMPFEGKAPLGTLSVKGNDVYWNGQRLASGDERALSEACFKGLKDAGVTVPAGKPVPPPPGTRGDLR